MTPDELLFALAPDARAVKAARESMRAFSDLRRSADGQYLHGRCHGSDPTPYATLVHRTDAVRCTCDCGSMKYPCKHALALVALNAEHPDRFAAFEPTPSQTRTLGEAFTIELPAAPEAPTSAGEALLQAIFANPSDDAARLIYADWLTDHGTPADNDRAEFIRLDTRYHQGERSPEFVREWNRIWQANRVKWLADVPQSVRGKVATVGGFVRSATLTWTQMRQHGETLAEHHPIDILNLGGKLDLKTASKVGVMPLWARIRAFTWRNAHDVSLPALELIFRNHHLSGVRDLTIQAVDVTVHEVRLLAGWRDRTKVESLTFEECGLSTGAADALADAFGPTLKRLTLIAQEPDSALVRALAEHFGERFTFQEQGR